MRKTQPKPAAKALFSRAAHAAKTAAFYAGLSQKYALEAQALMTLALTAQKREARAAANAAKRAKERTAR